MVNLFGIGKYIGKNYVKKPVTFVCGVVCGFFEPDETEEIVKFPHGDLGLDPHSRLALEEAFLAKDKKTFVELMNFYCSMLGLDKEKVAYAIVACLEAMKRGSTHTVQGACLNMIGASFFK